VSHISGLCLLVLIASIGSAILEEGARAATPTSDHIVVHINANEVPPSSLPTMTALPSAARWVVQGSVTQPPGPIGGSGQPTLDEYIRTLGVNRIFIDCPTLAAETQSVLDDCQEQRDYRLVYEGVPGPILPAGRVIQYEAGDLTTPEAVLNVRTSGPLPEGPVIVTTTDVLTPGTWTPSATFYYHLPSDVRALDKFTSSLSRLAPSATMNVFDLDLDSIETYRVERGAIGSGIVMAFGLALAAFLVSSMASAQERRADNVSLAVLGMRRRTLRAAQRYQTLLPLLIALPLAIGTGWLASNTLLLADSRHNGWYFGSLGFTAILCIVALLAAWVSGALFVGARPRSEDLRRE
jgi:hypothetical protein